MDEHPEEAAGGQSGQLTPPEPHAADGTPAAKAPMSLRHMVIIAVAASVAAVGIIGGLVWALAGGEAEPDHFTAIRYPCNLVEIYDPQLAAANVVGANNQRKAKGSDIGCLPVCVLVDVDGDGQVGRGDALEFDRIATGLTQQPFGVGSRWLLATETSVFSDDRGTEESRRQSDRIEPSEFLDGIVEIRVAPNQSSCQAYNAQGEVVELTGSLTPTTTANAPPPSS